MESGAISNGKVRASTEWDANHAAIQARLHFKAGSGKAGSWSARHNSLGQWLQIDLGFLHFFPSFLVRNSATCSLSTSDAVNTIF